MHNMDAEETLREKPKRGTAQESYELYSINLGSNTPQNNSSTAITNTIQVRRTRNAGHRWKSKDELISDFL